MASGRLLDYLGSGVIADRPTAPDIDTDCVGIWYATDTDAVSFYAGGSWHTAGSYSDEQARDAIGAALVQGTGITISVNDGSNTITIACSVSQYTDEMAMDAIATMLLESGLLSAVYVDGSDTYTLTVSSASASEIQTGSITNKALTPGGLFAAAAFTALTDGATVTPDFNAGLNFSWTIGGNRTLANPTNAKEGQSGIIQITQDGTGTRVVTYGSKYKFPGTAAVNGVLSTAAGKIDAIAYTVNPAGNLICTLLKDIS